MKLAYSFSLLFLLITINLSSQTNKNKYKTDDHTFVPTKEWQVVKKLDYECLGQPIPKGLDVRVNFETGITEAKLLDSKGDDDKNSAVSIVSDEESAANEDKQREIFLSPKEMKEAIKNIKNDDTTKATKSNKYRTYEEIKDELGEANMFPKTDAEVIKKLLNEYIDILPKKDNTGTILSIVQDLEYLAHQYDNAIEFISLNGFRELIYKNLNISNAEIKKTTLVLLGSLAQNNPKVQIHALESGSVNILLRFLTIETDNDVNIKVIYALGSILRRFPLAQLKLIDNGGLSTLLKLFESDNIKLRLKMTILLNDLIFEHDILEVVQEDPQTTYFKDKIAQYERVNIKKKLLQMGYCDYINNLLINTIIIDQNDYESIEISLIAMSTVLDQCKCHYSNDILKNLLKDSEKVLDNEINVLVMNILKKVKTCNKDEL